jgi:hypothetical protein
VTPLVVVILAAMWVLVLVPPLLRSRSDSRPSTSIGSFRQQLATLSRTGPERRGARSFNRPMGAVPISGGPLRTVEPLRRAPAGYRAEYDPGVGRYAPERARRGGPASVGYSTRSARADVRRRRQNVLMALVLAAVVTGVGGFGFGVNALIGINLLIDALLIFYVYLLVQLRRAEEQRAMRQIWSQAA